MSTSNNLLQMLWNCKHCIFSANKRGLLLKHYRLKHGTFTLQQPIPCLHMDCLCSFKSFNALKVHLSVWHSQSDRQTSEPKVAFHCQLREYVLINKHPCLKEQGSPDGCSSWKHSLKFKMGNYRTKLRKAG